MRTTKLGLSRRKMLRGMLHGAAVSVALPRLDAMLNGNGTAYAAGASLPRRFGVWAWANGVRLSRWVPAKTGAGFPLSDELAPLGPVRDYVSVVSGLDLPFGGRSHAAGNCVFMTGQPLAGTNDADYTFPSASLDQAVAAAIGPTTPIRSLELGVTDAPSEEKGTAFHWWSHTGPNSPNRCNFDTKAVFTRLFGAGAVTPAGPTAVDVTQAMRRSVLDVVAADAADLRPMLGARDRARLEQHLDGIRAIETRLGATGAMRGGASVSCASPPAPPALVGSAVDYDARVKLINQTMAELLALALACDLTRVFTYQLVQPGTEVLIKSVIGGAPAMTYDAHDLSHMPDGYSADDPLLHTIVVHYMSELAVLVQALRAMPEGAGTLLDSCGILAANDVTDGPSHSYKSFPVLVIGRAGGRLRSGVHVASAGNVLRVPLTVARAVGHDALASFGAREGLTSDPLSELLV